MRHCQRRYMVHSSTAAILCFVAQLRENASQTKTASEVACVSRNSYVMTLSCTLPHPQAFRQQFTAVLCAPGVLGCQQLHALVGRSNKLMRQHLAAYGCAGQLAGLLEQQQQQVQGKQLVRRARSGVGQQTPLVLTSATVACLVLTACS
jgi:hypothetical protein